MAVLGQSSRARELPILHDIVGWRARGLWRWVYTMIVIVRTALTRTQTRSGIAALLEKIC